MRQPAAREPRAGQHVDLLELVAVPAQPLGPDVGHVDRGAAGVARVDVEGERAGAQLVVEGAQRRVAVLADVAADDDQGDDVGPGAVERHRRVQGLEHARVVGHDWSMAARAVLVYMVIQ